MTTSQPERPAGPPGADLPSPDRPNGVARLEDGNRHPVGRPPTHPAATRPGLGLEAPRAASRYAALLARREQARSRSGPLLTGGPSGLSERDRHPLGTGWQAPMTVTVRGTLGLQSGPAHVATCIRLILGTRPGERRMRPELGCALHDFFFAPNTPQTRYRIQKAIEGALETQEPRIEDLQVEVTPDPRALERVNIVVKYRLQGALSQSAQRFALELEQ